MRVLPLSGDDLKSRLTTVLNGVGPEIIERSVNALDTLNQALGRALGPNSTLGHSYLFDLGLSAGAPSYWMEVDGAAVATGTQLQVTKDWASRLLVGAGSGKSLSSKGNSVQFTVHHNGMSHKVRLENPSRGNVRFTGMPFHEMNNGVTVWRPIGTSELALEYLPFDGPRASGLAGYQAKSSWQAQSTTRRFGQFRSESELSGADREKAVWRYAILPQLLDTVTQAFSLDILTAESRRPWLDANLSPSAAVQVEKNLESFEGFLNGHLGLKISLAGQGLAAGLVVEEFVSLEPAAGEPTLLSETGEA